jgi:tRNA G18 (ribose-2'-O)-methylase SpoU
MIEPITTADDPRIAIYRDLKDAQLDRAGSFIAEGRLIVRALLGDSRFAPRSLLLTPAALESVRDLVDPVAGVVGRPEIPVYVAAAPVLEAIAGFDVHRGCLAAAHRGPAPSASDALAGIPAGRAVVLVLEDVNNHDNIGGMFRCAAAFGVAAVLLTPGCVDPLYRKAVRVSMGSVLRVPWGWLRAEPSAASRGEFTSSAADTAAMLRLAGFRTLALTPASDATDLRDIDPRAHPRVALMLGAEGPGLSPAALAAADARVKIAMTGAIDSLNVTTAAAIALHHVAPRP